MLPDRMLRTGEQRGSVAAGFAWMPAAGDGRAGSGTARSRTSRILQLIERLGLGVTIFLATAALSAMSVSLASLTHALTGDPIGWTGLLNTMLIPFVLGVPTLIVLLNLLRELERARVKLDRLSTFDTLTGTLNRRSLLEHGEVVCSALSHRWDQISLILVDADCFKQVNDRHGHLIGDHTLCRLVEAMERCLPETALCGRFGGEEFAIVLPGLNAAAGLALGEELRRSVQQHCREVEGRPVQATISVGVASSEADSAELVDLLARADAALYVAKRLGRNRVQAAAT